MLLRVDGVQDRDKLQCALTLYKWEDRPGPDVGYIASSTLVTLGTVVALVLMAVFL